MKCAIVALLVLVGCSSSQNTGQNNHENDFKKLFYMVSPNFTTTAPSACSASLPVSSVIIRPSPMSNVC